MAVQKGALWAPVQCSSPIATQRPPCTTTHWKTSDLEIYTESATASHYVQYYSVTTHNWWQFDSKNADESKMKEKTSKQRNITIVMISKSRRKK